MKNVNYSIQGQSTVITADSSFIDCVVYNANFQVMSVVIKGKSYMYGCTTANYIDFNNVLHVTKSLGKAYNAIKKRLEILVPIN